MIFDFVKLYLASVFLFEFNLSIALNKFLKMIFTIMLFLLIAIAVFLFFNQPKFGRRPSGERLEKILKAPNYKDGEFQNISLTPDLTEGANFYTVLKDFFFGKSKTNSPSGILPSQKTDLKNLDASKDILVWFGHSSYFMQLNGKNFLVDPVFSNHASPLSFTVNSFKGSNAYSPKDMPEIDYLIISHDHWDHLDYDTILELKPKIKKIITSLGTGEHLERWNFDSTIVSELNWHEGLDLGFGFKINAVPARHFSGRGFKRNQAVWLSFVLDTPSKRIYIGGDSGYDTFFKESGDKFGPFDLAILECGQYNKHWKYIHMMPEQTVQAAQDLNAKVLLPVHWGKFPLAFHDWDEPIKRVVATTEEADLPIVYPMIGETLDLDVLKAGEKWWEGVR